MWRWLKKNWKRVLETGTAIYDSIRRSRKKAP